MPTRVIFGSTGTGSESPELAGITVTEGPEEVRTRLRTVGDVDDFAELDLEGQNRKVWVNPRTVWYFHEP